MSYIRNDFEVSTPELDLLVSLATACTGVYGSRMTGGGFGGCTVTLLKKSCVADVVASIRKGYEVDGRKASFVVASPAEGARIVQI